MRSLLIFPLSSFLLLLAACKGPTVEETYDQQTHQPPITRHAQIDSILNTLEAISFDHIDPAYLETNGIEGKWKTALAKKKWYKVRGKQAFQYLVGTFRIENFLPRDAAWEQNRNDPDAGHIQYLCMDKRILHKLLDLMKAMEKQGMDTRQMAINYGFRPPTYNTLIGGATRSRHQWGEAIDLIIGDVNRDGRMDDCDKAPLIAMLDRDIIGDGGGVGKYPHSQIIHMDVRGHRARWDFQK
jgi:hypothetical protein